MRPSFNEAVVPLQEHTAMSAQGPSNPLGDRPRMAEALASLKEGLRETADPLYDGWKLRPRTPGSANPQASPVQNAAPPSRADEDSASAPLDDAGETIEITMGGPDETPSDDTANARRRSGDDAEPETPRVGDRPGDGLSTQVPLIEGLIEDAAPTVERRSSVQADTVRVRIIRYQPFPKWALVAVAALVVFAVCVIALRASFPRESTHASRSVLASEVPTKVSAATAGRTGFSAARATVAPLPPTVPAPSRSAARSAAITDHAPAAPPSPREAPPRPTAAIVSPPAVAPSPPPASKTPSSAPRRRPAGHDFFRDPGF
jgi:hypothetical protein